MLKKYRAHSLRLVRSVEQSVGTIDNSTLGLVLMQAVGFHSVLLVKLSESWLIDSERVGRALSQVNNQVASRLFAGGLLSTEEARRTLMQEVGGLLSNYGDMDYVPLELAKSTSELRGTLLWEYTRLIADTLGRADDSATIMLIAKQLNSAAKDVDPQEVVNTMSDLGASGSSKKGHLDWYWLSLTGALLSITGAIIGNVGGAWIGIGGHLFLLFSLVSAISGGIKGKSGAEKITVGSRVGAFFAALGVAFVILAIATQF